MKLNRFQNWVIRAIGLLDFDFNQALRDEWRTAMKIGIEKGEQNKADCKVCPLWQREQKSKIGAYERPDPTTYGKLAAQRMEQPFAPPAWFKRRNPDLIQTQHMLPRMTRKLTLEQHSEPPPGSTPYETPAFLQDQEKKIS